MFLQIWRKSLKKSFNICDLETDSAHFCLDIFCSWATTLGPLLYIPNQMIIEKSIFLLRNQIRNWLEIIEQHMCDANNLEFEQYREHESRPR